MNSEIDKKYQQKRLALLEERRRLLAMPAEQALDAILDHPEPLPLVHSFSGEDLYFLVHDIGVNDALPILGMASESQWEYILDVEVWKRDRIDVQPALQWMDQLLKADPDRLLRWIQGSKRILFEFCLLNFIAVRVREHDEDPSTFGDDFFTLDGTYYIRLLKSPVPDDPETGLEKEMQEIVRALLEKTASVDHLVFQNMLAECSSIIRAETEEELYRWRNVRMAEKGFPPFEEAVGIYQPLPPGVQSDMRNILSPQAQGPEPHIPLSLYPVAVLEGDDLFSQAMHQLESEGLYTHLESEFAALCNAIVAADQKVIRERSALRVVVDKACGYISIGLQHLTGRSTKPEMHRLLSIISRNALSHIFKVGYGLAQDLKWRAERWQRESWFQKNNLALGFWGESWTGVLGGLLLDRPLFFDHFQTGTLYREFRSIPDIEITEAILDQIICFDGLFAELPFSVRPVAGYHVTYQNALLTLWVRDQLGLEAVVAPIELDRFRSFFTSLFDASGQAGLPAQEADPEKGGRISMNSKTAFVVWVSKKSGQSEQEITFRYGTVFDQMFTEIEAEYGRVRAKDLDPRYVHLFLLQKKEK